MTALSRRSNRWFSRTPEEALTVHVKNLHTLFVWNSEQIVDHLELVSYGKTPIIEIVDEILKQTGHHG